MINVALASVPNVHYARRVELSPTMVGLVTMPVPPNLFHRRVWMAVEISGATAQSFQGELVALLAGQAMFKMPFLLNWAAGPVITPPLLFWSQDSFNTLIQPDTIDATGTGGLRLTALSFTAIADEIGINITRNTLAANGNFQIHVRSQTKL